jgi:HEAT repeat protein
MRLIVLAALLAGAGFALGQPGRRVLALALPDEDGEVRREAARAIRRLCPPAALVTPALVRALRDEDATLRLLAVEALGSLAPLSKDAIPALIEATKDSDRRVRRRATGVFGAFGPYARPALPRLIAALKDEDTLEGYNEPSIPTAAAFALGYIGSDAAPAVPALLEALKRKDTPLRNAATRALGYIGPTDERVIPTLLGLLSDKNEVIIREAAAASLARIGPPAAKEAVPPLLAIFKARGPSDSAEMVLLRATVARFLGAFDESARPAVRPLLAAMKDADAPPAAREGALKGIVQLGPVAKEVLPDLLDLYLKEGAETYLCWDLQLYIIGLGATAVPVLVQRIGPTNPQNDRMYCMDLLRVIGRPAKGAVPELLKIRDENNRRISAEAQRALEGILLPP